MKSGKRNVATGFKKSHLKVHIDVYGLVHLIENDASHRTIRLKSSKPLHH